MPYAQGRIYNDADSHIMETESWLASYADPKIRDRIPPPDFTRTGVMANDVGVKRDWSKVDIEKNLLILKGWGAYGAYDAQERTKALDLLGFNRQLVFSSIASGQFWGTFAQSQHEPDLMYGGTRALNRAIADFCAHDQRLMPVGFLPLDVPELAEEKSRKQSSSASVPYGFRRDRRVSVRRPIQTWTACGRGCRKPTCRSCCMSARVNCQSPQPIIIMASR